MTCCNTNVTDFLLEGKASDRVALQLLNEEYSYGDLLAGVSMIAGYLIDLGCQKGDRAILVGENSFFWVVAYLGILRAGLVCVPVPLSISAQDLAYVLKTTEARTGFVQAGFGVKNGANLVGIHLMTDRETSHLPNLLSQTSFVEQKSNSSGARPVFPHVCRDDLAALMFTSGSTGKPRGVMVSHRNIMANTESVIQYLELTEADRMMTVLPFHYCFGTSLLHTHLRVGGSLVVDLRFLYSETFLQRMLDTQCTGFAGVPSHFQILLRSSSLRKKRFPHLRHVQQAGGHLAPIFIGELQEALPQTKIFVMYGQTEATARLSYLAPEYLNEKPGSIGKGIPGVKLSVLNERGQQVRRGEVGEIVAEGENITLGYWRASEETAVHFRNGKLHTGDMATVDDDGFIYIVDRAKDLLKCGGQRFSCRQVEDRLLECDELLEVAVVGMPDEVLGEAVKAFVVPRMPSRNGIKESVRLFCKQHMPPQLVPREIVVTNALPKNSAGKVLKQELRGV